MGPDLRNVQLDARRAIEAELALRVYASALPFLGEEKSLAMLNDAIDSAATEAGQRFAAQAPNGQPSLEHFSGVLDLWQAGGALTIADIERTQTTLKFSVMRCGYMEMYTAMGIPAVLHPTLSCRRDAAFAAGYSPKLRLSRPQVISAGAPSCRFEFRWQC